jgi:hypothetical protein
MISINIFSLYHILCQYAIQSFVFFMPKIRKKILTYLRFINEANILLQKLLKTKFRKKRKLILIITNKICRFLIEYMLVIYHLICYMRK